SITCGLERGKRLSGRIDLAQDVFALGFPNVAPRIVVARGDERDDGVGQFSGRGKALLGNELGEVAEEALDQIHPGGRGRRVVHVKAGVPVQPSGDRGCLWVASLSAMMWMSRSPGVSSSMVLRKASHS